MPPPGFVTERFVQAPDFLRALASWDDRWSSSIDDWIFRGQADAAWNLVPSAFRADVVFRYGSGTQQFRLRRVHREQIREEAHVIQRFLLGIDQQGLALPTETSFRWHDFGALLSDVSAARTNPEWPPPDMAALFALAQHNGIPTRLLDWTWRPLVAAYFAAIDGERRFRTNPSSSAEYIALWALSFTRASLTAMVDINNKSQPELRMVRPPRASNPNLRAQEGVFTVLVDRKRSWNDKSDFPALNLLLEQRLEEHLRKGKQMQRPILYKFELLRSESGRLLRLLAKDWVSATHLYHGLAGVVAGLREHEFWDNASEKAVDESD